MENETSMPAGEDAHSASKCRQPESEIELLQRALIDYRQGRWQEAESLFVRLLDRQPGQPEALQWLGITYRNLSRWEEARGCFARLVEMQPDHREALLYLGITLINMQDWDGADSVFGNLLAIQPAHFEGLFYWGITLQNLNRWEEAAEAFQRALMLLPNDAETLFQLGFVYQSLQRWEEAEKRFSQAVDAVPDNVRAMFHLGFVCEESGKWDEAVSAFTRLLAIQPDHCNGLLYTGLAYRGLERWEEAQAAFAHLLRLKSDHSGALLYGGITFMNRRMWVDAETSFSRLVELQPNHLEALYYHGMSLMSQKKFESAASRFAQVLSLRPAHSEALIQHERAMVSLRQIERRAESRRFQGEGSGGFPMRFCIDSTRDHLWPVGPKSRIRLISTLPKTGTWALHYFWTCFDALLAGRDEADPFYPVWQFDGLSIDLFVIAHMFHPEFEATYRGPHRKAWDELSPCTVGLDWGNARMLMHGQDVLPSRNEDWKLIYFYRNPFDQMLSYHRVYSRDFNKPGHPYLVRDAAGLPIQADTLSQFCRNTGIRSFVKQFFTFWAMRESYADRMLMLSYEEMMRSRSETYLRMTEFFLGRLDDTQRRAFDTAIEQSSFEALSALERRLGTSIEDGPTISRYFESGTVAKDENVLFNKKHINSGQIGAWKEVLPAEDVDFCMSFMKSFGIDPGVFVFE